MPLTLSAGSVSLTLGTPDAPFTEKAFPREEIEITGITFSPYGTPAIDGPFRVSKCLWNLVALVTFDDAEKLSRLAVLSRSQNLLLIDEIDRVWEVGAPTRAIAPDTIATTEDGLTGYFAQFYARFTQPLKQSHVGIYRRVTLQLTETDKVAP